MGGWESGCACVCVWVGMCLSAWVGDCAKMCGGEGVVARKRAAYIIILFWGSPCSHKIISFLGTLS